MCGRYANQYGTWSEIKAGMELLFTKEDEGVPEPNFNIGPMKQAPIILSDGTDTWGVTALWSLYPSWFKDDLTEKKYPTFNARSETVAEKPAFRSSIKRHRCLVPATAFYEWKKVRNEKKKVVSKQAFAIGMSDDHPFAMAGIWSHWSGTKKGEPWKGYTFSILTCPPNPLMEDIHDRMPVILHPENYQDWLSNDTEEALQLAVPLPSQLMRAWEVDGRVGNVKATGEDLLDPVDAGRLL